MRHILQIAFMLFLCAVASSTLAQVTIFPSGGNNSTVSVGTASPGGVTITQPTGVVPSCTGTVDATEGCPLPMLGI
jgi:hypothetical protein